MVSFVKISLTVSDKNKLKLLHTHPTKFFVLEAESKQKQNYNEIKNTNILTNTNLSYYLSNVSKL